MPIFPPDLHLTYFHPMKHSLWRFLALYAGGVGLWLLVVFAPELPFPVGPPPTPFDILWSQFAKLALTFLCIMAFPSVLLSGFLADAKQAPVFYGMMLTLPISAAMWTWFIPRIVRLFRRGHRP